MSSITKKITFAIFFALITIAVQGQIIVSGTVKTEKGVNLVGAYITVDSTKIATLSDLEGKFTLAIPEKYANYNISINYAGYVSKTIKAQSGAYDIQLMDKETQSIEEIMVSTQKRLQRLIDVPITESIIDSTKIRQTGLYRIDDMSNFVPGFYASTHTAQHILYNIRGVSSSGVESYGQSRISVYLNGVSISRIQTANMEQYDMDKVEIVKGPQGTLFGRGAELGAVGYHSKKPADEFSASIATSYGNYNQRKVVGVLNTPLGSSIANRLAMCYNAHDGFIKNSVGGRLNGQNTIALRNSTTFKIGDNFKLDLMFDYQHDDNPGTSYQSKTQYDDKGSTITTDKSPFTTASLTHGSQLYTKRDMGGFNAQFDWDISKHFDIINVSGIRAHNSDEYYDIDGSQLRILDGHDMSKGFQVSEELRVNWSLGEKNEITGSHKIAGFFGGSYFYERARHRFVFEGNLRYIYPLTLGKNLRTSLASLPERIITNIQNLVVAWAEPVKAAHPENAEEIDMICGEFNQIASQRIREQVGTLFSKWFDVIYWEETPDFFEDTKTTISQVLMQSMEDMAEQHPLIDKLLKDDGQDMKGVLEELNIGEGFATLAPYSNVSLDEDHYENETDYNRTYEASVFADFTWNIYKRLYLTAGLRSTYETLKTGYYSSSMTAPVLGSIIFANTGDKTVWTDKKYQSLVGRVVLNWMPNGTHNIYLSAARGRRPGMIYYDYNPDDIISLSPETTTSYELGIKGRSKYGHLTYEVAVYYFDWQHFQTLVIGREARESGALSYQSDDNGKAYGAGTEMSGTYTFNPNISIFADFAYTGGTFSDKDMKGNEQGNSGNHFGMTPQYTFDMGFNWKHPISSNKTIYFYPSFYTQSKMFIDDNNTPEYAQSAYIIFNANAGYMFTRGRATYDIGIYGRNITNTKYLTDAGNGGEVLGLPTYEIGYPATINLSFRVQWK